MNRRLFLRITTVLVAIICILLTTGTVWAQGQGVNGPERAKEAQEKHTAKLMEKKGVVGTAIGIDEANEDEAVVLVLLEHGNVPDIPARLDGVKVKKEVTGKIYALADPTARFPRPVPIGVSTGHPDITAGTIGCRVTDGTGNVYALSNNHVFANENLASLGDDVIQPGPYDGGTVPNDIIGTLADFEPIVFGGNNTMDAAIVFCTTDTLGAATPEDGYGTPSSDAVAPASRMKIMKYGRTTGFTNSRITGTNATVEVGYDTGVAIFVGQIYIRSRSFSAGGDSGSLIVTENGKNPVGLLFAGSSNSTIANPILPVLARFGVTVDDGSSTPPANQAPTADAGSDQTVTDSDDNGSESVGLNGAGSSDPDGTIDSYVWTEAGTEIATGQSPPVSLVVGTHTITLTVTDDAGATDTDEVVITVNAVGNQAPIADAGDDQTVSDSDGNGSEPVVLDGSGSSDPDGTIALYVWTEAGTEIATGQSPSVSLAVGTHTITLTVTDDDDATDTDEVVITVSSGGTGTTLHVADIQVDKVGRGRGNATAQATVLIVDESGNPVSGATVTVVFTGAIDLTETAIDGGDKDVDGVADGRITIVAPGTYKNPCRTTGCVDNVILAGYDWDGATPCDNSW